MAYFLEAQRWFLESDCFHGPGFLNLNTLPSSDLCSACRKALHVAQMQGSHPNGKAFLGFLQISYPVLQNWASIGARS